MAIDNYIPEAQQHKKLEDAKFELSQEKEARELDAYISKTFKNASSALEEKIAYALVSERPLSLALDGQRHTRNPLKSMWDTIATKHYDIPVDAVKRNKDFQEFERGLAVQGVKIVDISTNEVTGFTTSSYVKIEIKRTP